MSVLFFRTVLQKIEEEETLINMEPETVLDDSILMTVSLNVHLNSLKEYVTKNGFENPEAEIDFFRNCKPEILGKLLYYRKVFKIETGKPVDIGDSHTNWYKEKLIKQEDYFRKKIQNTGFYRYYRAGLTEKDSEYFTRGQINPTHSKRQALQIDHSFSTFYDHTAAKIKENDLLIKYLHERIHLSEKNASASMAAVFQNKIITWTDSKNALIELIYALHAAESISNGKLEIKKTAAMFQSIFGIDLGDVHHAFHRMKTRSGDRSFFLNKLIKSLEFYMDKDL